MSKARAKKKREPIAFKEYPLIGYEYRYICQPVRVVRVCPSVVGSQHGHVEFETRFCERSCCDAGELSDWQDVTDPLTEKRATLVMLAIRDAIEDATSDGERRLAKWQLRRLTKLRRDIIT